MELTLGEGEPSFRKSLRQLSILFLEMKLYFLSLSDNFSQPKNPQRAITCSCCVFSFILPLLPLQQAQLPTLLSSQWDKHSENVLPQLLIVFLVSRLMSSSLTFLGLSLLFKAMTLLRTFGRSQETRPFTPLTWGGRIAVNWEEVELNSRSELLTKRIRMHLLPSFHIYSFSDQGVASKVKIVKENCHVHALEAFKKLQVHSHWNPATVSLVVSHLTWLELCILMLSKLVHFSPNLTSKILIIFHESFGLFTRITPRSRENSGSVWEFFPIYLSISVTIEHDSLVRWEEKRETRLASNPLELSCNSCPVSQVEGQEGQR